MSGSVSAEEIADDFRHNLEYLQSPDRYAINNFTVIAKENTEHADAVSNVLVDHIRKAPPHHKLPALYVLDSIAKNIGTPYSLFLGHKLYGVFMESYSSVDPATRKKLDEMLKTWKAPVPGSIDPTPVFPVEITRRIENALIQAKTAALKYDHNHMQNLQQKRPASVLATTQWRNTPTPTQQNTQHLPPASSLYFQKQTPLIPPHTTTFITSQQSIQHVQPPLQLGFTQNIASHIPEQNPYQNAPFHAFQPSRENTAQQSSQLPILGLDMNLLHRDIDQLIENCRYSHAGRSQEHQRLSKVQALLALKELLNRQSLPPDQLTAVRRQVDDLQVAERRGQNGQVADAGTQPMPQSKYTVYDSNQNRTSMNTSLLNHTPASVTSNMTSLLAQASGMIEDSPLLQSSSPLPTPPKQVNSVNVGSLLASLTKSGLLGQSPVVSDYVAPVISPENNSLPNNSFTELLARATGSDIGSSSNNINLTSSSLKISRPSLYKLMLENRPNQCVSCGLRFRSSREGRTRKADHMDWHFQANQRIQDSTKGIQSRSWFVGELDWIRSKNLEEQGEPIARRSKITLDDSNYLKVDSKYVSVPSDPEAHQPCPICQERFDTGFNQEIQDWVWLDAIRVGQKIYHATCFSDLRKDGLDSRDRTATPDSILGKRKAEPGSVDTSPIKKPVTGL